MEKDQNTTPLDEGNEPMARTKIASNFGWMYMLIGPVVTFAFVSFFRGNISSVVLSIFAIALIAIFNSILRGDKLNHDTPSFVFEDVPSHRRYNNNPDIIGTPAYLINLGRID